MSSHRELGPTGPVSLSIFWSVSHSTLFPSCSLATRAEKIQNISHSVCLNFVFIKKYCKSKTRIRPQTTGFKSSSSDGVADVILRWTRRPPPPPRPPRRVLQKTSWYYCTDGAVVQSIFNSACKRWNTTKRRAISRRDCEATGVKTTRKANFTSRVWQKTCTTSSNGWRRNRFARKINSFLSLAPLWAARLFGVLWNCSVKVRWRITRSSIKRHYKTFEAIGA